MAARSRSATHRVVVGGLAVLVIVAVGVATRHGPGLSPDSVDYVTAAQNVRAGLGYVDFSGDPVTNWAPGYSYLLAAGEVIGLAPVDAARGVNAIALATTVVLAFLLMRRHVSSRALLFAGTAAVTLNPALLQNADHVWSESLFIAFCTGFTLILEDLVSRRERRIVLIPVAALIVGCAFLIRFPGIWLAATGVLVLVIDGWKTRSLHRSVRDAVVFGALSSIIPIAWLVRTASVTSDDVFGLRVPSGLGPFEIVDRVLRGAGYWLLPERAPHSLAVIVGTILTVVVVVAVVASLRSGRGDRDEVTCMPLVVLVTTYVILVIVSNVTAGADINSRTMSPLIVPVAVLIFTFLDTIDERLRTQATAARVLTGFVLVVVLLQGIVFVATVARHGRDPGGYGARVQASELVDVAERLPAHAALFSNDPWAIAYGSAERRVQLMPTSLEPGMSHRPATVDDVAHAAACPSGAYLAWFATDTRSHPPVFHSSTGRSLPLHRLTRARDGTLYRFKASPEGRCRSVH